MNILIVDDEPLIRMDLEEMLRLARHSVTTAVDVGSALTALEHNSIHTILADVDMPGSMGGLELAAMVADRWPSVGIVVMSGKCHPMDQLPAGARFLPKPISSSVLLAALDHFLQPETM